MLAVILHITLELLRGGPPDDRESTVGGVLANTLLKVRNPVYSYCFVDCPGYGLTHSGGGGGGGGGYGES